MDTITVAIEFPVELYAEIEMLATEEQIDLQKLLVKFIKDGYGRHQFQKGWRELREMVQRDGGLNVGETTEEIVEQMRKTRYEIFEEEYAHLYR